MPETLSHGTQRVKIDSTKRPEGAGVEHLELELNGPKAEGAEEVGTMPGIIMEESGINGANSFRDTEWRINGGPADYEMMDDKRKVLEGLTNGASQLNGIADLSNGVLTNGDSSSPARTLVAPSDATNPFHQLPPEIEHITFGYLPLSKLITRLVQESFNDLTEVINDMSAMQIPQQTPQVNSNYLSHVNGNMMGAASQTNVQKKLRMLNFAQDRRAQFIKLLVLSQWSRQAGDVSKAIDLKVWLDRQKGLYEDAGGWMGELKRNLGPAKMPNPDLRTALEVLSTGKASWLPDVGHVHDPSNVQMLTFFQLGYVPPDPLTPQQMLKTLRNINTLLSIRLNLHEIIPSQFKTLSIASGRATFSVANEFEVDLSIADEDPTSQLYFIDFRFAFSPSPSDLPSGRLRDEIEGRANDVLKKDGLAGCYSFLHDFVLTYKINVLKSQAIDMARNQWTESLRIEPVHRTLVVQYWLNRPGGKSWIEIGIKSGRRKDQMQLQGEAIPHIALRWIRNGKEVKDPPLTFDLGKLSMENIVKNVIALHSNFILQSICTKLSEEALYASHFLSIALSTSHTEPVQSSLKVQLTASKSLTVAIEPSSGTFTLQPASPMFTRAERDINNLPHPVDDAATRLANLRWIVAQEDIASRARCTEWELLKGRQLKQEDMARWFPRDTLRVSFFRRKSWSRDWLVACTSSRGGESWWIIELQSDRLSSLSNKINVAHLIPPSSLPAMAPTASHAFLAKLESVAAGMISYFVNTRYLFHLNIRHVLSPPWTVLPGTNTPILYIRFTPNMVPSFLRTPQRPVLPWAHEIIKVTFRGIDTSSQRTGNPSRNAILLAEARMVTPIPQIKLLTSRIDSSIAFHPSSGAFTFRLLSPVGQPVIPALLDRLKRIERLIRFLAVLKQYNLKYETISLARIVFTYATNPLSLKADINFATDAPMRISFEKGNPHLRIKDFLDELLNADGGLEHVTLLLGITLPLLRAIDALEAPRSGHTESVIILPRSAEWFQLRYSNPKCRFDIRLRQRKDEVKWFLRDVSTEAEISSCGEEFERVLKAMFVDRGEGWFGLRTGIVASVGGVEGLLRKLDDVVRGAAAGESNTELIGGAGEDGVVVVLD
ncbi:MAG: mediator complex subunit [Pleopsidium flavum]|nr:MAG: mediator complex subunit [Pleopsidium flavum]